MNDFYKIVGALIKISEEGIPGHYRKKEFFVKFIRAFDRVDLNDFNEFRGISAAFDEALDLAQFSGIR